MPLNSRTKLPPGGWKWLQPETGWEAPHPLHESFTKTVQRIADHRRNNPRFGLTMDPEAIAIELEDYTCHRLNGDPRYCTIEEGEKKKSSWWPVTEQKPVAALARRAKKTAAGVKCMREWLGNGAIPVAQEEAECRTNICAGCPKNDKGNWWDMVTGAVAEAIKSQLQTKENLRLSTSKETEIGTCSVCYCHLPLKVWVPMEHIKKYTDEETLAEFPSNCWIYEKT